MEQVEVRREARCVGDDGVGREYLAATVSATGYQGYAGPGWTVAMLVPIDQAFRADEAGRQGAQPTFPAGALADSNLVAEELRSIEQRERTSRS